MRGISLLNRWYSLFRAAAWAGAAALVVSGCGGGGGGSSVPMAAPSATVVGLVPATQPTVAPSPSSSPATTNAAAYVCPTSDTATAALRSRTASGEAVRRPAARHSGTPAAPATGTQLLAVSYDSRTLAAEKSTLSAREAALGATLAREYSFGHTSAVTRILRVPAAQVSSAATTLRAQSGVRSVGITGTRRYSTAVSQPYFTTDPYFRGFSATVAAAAGATAPPATFEAGPLEENAGVPGQWDMHAMRLEYAFAYSQANNGSGITNPLALGSAAVKVAVIDPVRTRRIPS
jgi:hypothetical protein